jgi:hypothetical protein
MSLKYRRKTTASPNASQSVATPSIAVLRESTQRTATDSALQRFVTHFLHPIALTSTPSPMYFATNPWKPFTVEATQA